MSQAVFEPAILTGEQLQTHALDPAATGTGSSKNYHRISVSARTNE